MNRLSGATRTSRRGRTSKGGLRVAFALGLLAASLALTASASGLSTRGWAPQKSAAANLTAAADPVHISFTLEGCRNDGSIVLPDVNGDFVCPDTAYTTGNLGKGWNELDLVPHRVTVSASGGAETYSFIVAGDYKNGSGTGTGWDVITNLVLNASLSSASCAAATTGATTITPSGSGVGGADQTIYRLVTIAQPDSTTCVYDYAQRLALGAHNFSGSSLQSNLWNQNLSSNGIGQKRISLPNNPNEEIGSQSITKDMSATQGSDHAWDVTKSATPANVSFGNTCDTGATRSAAVSISVSWTKGAATASGLITVITHVYATNPAARIITVNVSDDIMSGTTVLDTYSPGAVDVPANTANFLVLTHQTTVPDGTADLNDVATASYTDKITGVPVPWTTTATAEADVQFTGSELNQTATIGDSESITGSFQYSADSFSGASGAFQGGYVAGTHTSGTVDWLSGSQSGNGSVTFSKTVYVNGSGGISSSGTLSDTATLNGSDGFQDSANASVSISSDARVKLTINKSIPNVLSGSETDTFNFEVYDSSNVLVASPTISFAAGQTSKSVDVTDLAAGAYTVKETGSTSGKWNADSALIKPSQSTTITLPSCSGSVSFTNGFGPAAAKVKKVTNPAGSEAGWEMTLTGPGTPVGGEKVTTTGTGFVNFATVLQEGNYTITETAKTGWDQTGSSTECSFTVNYPADSGHVFECTKTNAQRGSIIIKKVTNPNPDPSDTSFSFTAGGGLSPSGFSLKNGAQQTYSNVTPGSGYSAAESVPTGWDLTSSTCDDGSPVSNIDVAAGETVTCTFTNRARAKAKVVKTVSGGALGTQSFVFQLRSGASANSAGTILESGTANTGNGGVITFTTLLVPGTTYQLCEQMQPGWTTTLGPPLYSVFNPSGDNSVVCTDFTASAGETKQFAIDNRPPPGGMALTIGYWKNWSSCTGGGQKPTLDATLLKLAQAGTLATLGLLVLNPQTQSAATVCQNAVNILSKQTLGGKKMASDPLFNMAAQLLAADLNLGSGAGQCAASATAVNQGHALLTKYKFDGNGYTPKLTTADANLANSLATSLDKYNNNKLC